MNESHFAYRIRQNLNKGLHELPASTTDRLHAARERALSHQRIAARQSVLASAGHFMQSHLENVRPRQLVLALAVFASAIAYTCWDADQQISALGEIDSALLADDLPINAFTDKGFHAWLRSSSLQ